MNPESINFKTVYKKIRSMPPKLRKDAVSGKEGEHWLSLLTPTQFALLFPDYFKKALPDVGLTMAASGATVMGGRSPTVTSALPWSGETSQGGGRVSAGSWSGGGGSSSSAPTATPAPPDPNKVMEDKLKAAGIVLPEPEIPAGGMDRSKFAEELKDPKVMNAFAWRMEKEVGGQGSDAQLAWAETIFNRADSRKMSILDAVNGKDGYYPYGMPPGATSKNNVFRDTINKALTEGTDIAKGATGNASDTVGFGNTKGFDIPPGAVNIPGKPNSYRLPDGKVWSKGQTTQFGNKSGGDERFGVEQFDQKWYETNRAELKQRAEEAQKKAEEENRTGSAEPTGLTPGSPKPGKELTKPEGMNDELSKYFDSLSHAKQQALLQQFDKLGLEKVNKLAEESFAKNKVTALSTQGTEFVHELQGEVAATRKGALKSDLKEKLQYAAEQAGVQVEVVSGGQRMPGAPGAVGSTRHDDGGAADLKLFQVDKDGNKRYLDMRNPEDRTLMKKFAKESVKAGATGIGAGMGYMGASTMHIGGGRSTHWGGADFIGEAHSEGTAERNLGDFEKWKEMKQSATPVVGSETGSTRPTGLTPGSDPIPGRESTESKVDQMKKEWEQYDSPSTPAPAATPPPPIPMKDRGITTQAGHTAPSTTSVKSDLLIANTPVHPDQPLTREQMGAISIAKDMSQENYNAYPEHVRKKFEQQNSAPPAPAATPSAPTVTPAPAATPPAAPASIPAAKNPAEPGQLRGSQEGQGLPPGPQSAAPTPSKPVQTGQMEAGTKVAERTVSERRAYDRSNFSEKHYEGGAANVMKA